MVTSELAVAMIPVMIVLVAALSALAGIALSIDVHTAAAAVARAASLGADAAELDAVAETLVHGSDVTIEHRGEYVDVTVSATPPAYARWLGTITAHAQFMMEPKV